MQCTRCGRLTLKPALIVAGRAIGPTCAKIMGLFAGKVQKTKIKVNRDTVTMDLFTNE